MKALSQFNLTSASRLFLTTFERRTGTKVDMAVLYPLMEKHRLKEPGATILELTALALQDLYLREIIDDNFTF
jgi:hypothetical protein